MFDSVSVRELYIDTMEVSWKVTYSLDLTYTAFIVERSEAFQGPFEEVSQPLTSTASGISLETYQHLDAIKNLHRHRTLYYRVKAVDWRDQSEIAVSNVEWSRLPRDLIAMEIARRHNLLLRRFTGTPAYAYTAKTFGSKCSCWDPLKMRQRRSDCDECYNTGYSGGFLSPIPLFLSEDVDMRQVQIVDWGELRPEEKSSWTGHYPLLNPRDIIITDVDRYRVVNVRTINKKKSIVMQWLRLEKLDKSHVEWRLDPPDFDAFSRNDIVIRIYGGSSGDYESAVHAKPQDSYAGWDPTAETGTLRSEGEEHDTEIGV